jgi:hypothetical protein
LKQCPLVREGAPNQKTPQLSDNNQDLVVSPKWVLYSKIDWRLTVGRNIRLRLNKMQLEGAAVQSGLEPGSRRIAIVRNHYQETSSEDTAGWEN